MPPKRRGKASKKGKKKGKPSALKMAVKPTNVEFVQKSDGGNIVCNFCSKAFATAKRMRNHQRNCLMTLPRGKSEVVTRNLAISRKPKYSCKWCNKKFQFLISFKKHLTMEHSQLADSVPCDQCTAKCPNKEALKQHMEKAHSPVQFECPHCKARFSRNYHVLRHLEQKGCDGSSAILFNCSICGSTFTRKDNLMYHLRNNHMRHTKKFHCKQCLYSGDNYNKLVRHFTSTHMDSSRFECNECGKVVSSRMAIAKHLETHGEKKYECAICKYKSHTVEVMKRHLLCHTPNKPLKCTLCSASFIQLQQLRAHMSKHDQFVCDICDQNMETSFKLTIHMRKHLGLNTLTCPYQKCGYGKEFANEKALEKHMKQHSTKTFTCEVCSKIFCSELSMRRHTVTHTLERPRRCMYCVSARAYVRGERLVRHLRIAHADIFREHLTHVRNVSINSSSQCIEGRVKKSEIESILVIMDDLQDRVLQENGNGKVLYGGIVEDKTPDIIIKSESPLMSEEELTESLGQLLVQLIDETTLEAFGWPAESVDFVLEKVIEQCGQRVADRERWSRVQCLRENAKYLFLHVIEDKDIKRMLEMQTIDQVVRHILQVNS